MDVNSHSIFLANKIFGTPVCPFLVYCAACALNFFADRDVCVSGHFPSCRGPPAKQMIHKMRSSHTLCRHERLRTLDCLQRKKCTRNSDIQCLDEN